MRTYCDLPRAKILEVGSLNVNGCLRDASTPTTDYVGLDLEEGPSVDFVITPGAEFPVEDGSFDLVMASSVFEHDSRFWETFIRMCRAARVGGHIYVNAPSNGTVHRYPMDCWRFYPDAGLALADHARSEGIEIDLVESFIGNRHSDVWNDFVAVFRKGPASEPLNTAFVYHRYPSMNARTWQSREVYLESNATEDMMLITRLHAEIETLSQPDARFDDEREQFANRIAELQQDVRHREEAMAVLTAAADSRQSEIEQAHADKSHLDRRISELKIELHAREGDIAASRADQTVLAEEAEGHRHEIDQARADKTALEQRISALAADVRARDAAVETIRTEHAELAADMLVHRREIDRVHAAKAELETRVATIDTDLRLREQDVARSQVEAAALLGQVALLESNLRQRQEEIEQAWARGAEAEVERDRACDAVAALEDARDRLEMRLAESNADNFELAGERRSLETELVKVRAKLTRAEEAVRALQPKLAMLHDDMNAQRSSYNVILGDVDQLRELVRTPETMLEDAERLCDAWRDGENPLSEVAAILASLARTAATVAEQKRELHTDIEALYIRLEERERAAQRADAQVAYEGEIVQSLRSEARAHLERAAQAHEQLERLSAEQREYAQSFQSLQGRIAKKDGDLAWLRRYHAVLERSNAGLKGFLSGQAKRQRVAKILQSEGIFDGDAYLQRYPDVAQSQMDPLRHYLLHGMSEGRHI